MISFGHRKSGGRLTRLAQKRIDPGLEQVKKLLGSTDQKLILMVRG